MHRCLVMDLTIKRECRPMSYLIIHKNWSSIKHFILWQQYVEMGQISCQCPVVQVFILMSQDEVHKTDSQPSHYISCKVHSMTDGSHQIVLISVYWWIHLRLILETFMLKIVTLHRQNRLCWLDLRIHHCKNEQSEGENMYDELNYTSTAKHKHEPWFYVMSQSKVLIHQQKKVSTDSSN